MSSRASTASMRPSGSGTEEVGEPGSSGGVMTRIGQAFLRSATIFDKEPRAMGQGGGTGIGRDVGQTQYYVSQEILAARQAIQKLEKAVAASTSFREKGATLLEEAHRAISRLEKVVDVRGADELIEVACEIKVLAQRGVTLVTVHGSYGFIAKALTLMMRKVIYTKYQEVTESLRAVLPAPKPVPEPTPPDRQQGDRRSALARTSTPTAYPGQAPPATGTELRAAKHDKVYCVAYMPRAAGSTDTSVWWSAGQALEFYSTSGQSPSTSTLPFDKHTGIVTAISVDNDQYVWTGHTKGHVRVRRKAQWELLAEDNSTGGAIKVIAFDQHGLAWVGDDTGRIKVMKFDHSTAASKLQTVATLQHCKPTRVGSAARAIGHAHTASTCSDGAHLAATLSSASLASGASHGPATPGAGPSSGAADGHMQSSPNQGHGSTQHLATTSGAGAVSNTSAHRLRPLAFSRLGVSSTGASGPGSGDTCAENGPVRAIHIAGGHAWAGGGRNDGFITLWCTGSFRDVSTYETTGYGPCYAMHAISWPPDGARQPHMSLSRGGSNSSSQLPDTQQQAATGATSSAGATVVGWRLLTGHENGHLLMWHPSTTRLAPLLRIGEPVYGIRGIMVFEEIRLVCTAHTNGDLMGFVMPSSADALPPGSASDRAESLVCFRPRRFHLKAHKSALTLMVGYASSIVTVSSIGTVRLWDLEEIAAEAERMGMLPDRGQATGPLVKRSFTPHQLQSGQPGELIHAHTAGNTLPPAVQQLPGVSSCSTMGSRPPASASSYHTLSPAPRTQSTVTPSSNEFSSAAEQQAAPAGPSSVQAAPTPAASGSLAGQGAGSGSSRHPAPGMTHGLPSMPALGETSTAQQQQQQQQQRAGHARHSSTGTLDHIVNQMSGQPSGVSSDTSASALEIPQRARGAFDNSPVQIIEASELQIDGSKMIGHGAYGKVYLAEWTGCPVAVKELMGFSNSSDDPKAWQELRHEVHLLGTLLHPNIMRIMALCVDPPMIVMQYYSHGSLFDLLAKARKGNARAMKELTWLKRLDMMRDVAAGMHYLHTRKPPVVHGDLRSPNLLLDLTIDHAQPRYHVKIADFGLARMLGQASSMVAMSKMTNPRWTAPEVIRESRIGPAGDVYSFAIIMWEMMTWQQPFEEMMSVQVIFSTVSEDSRPELPADDELPGQPGVTLQQYKDLMIRCWHPDLRMRPTFKQIVEYFQAMRESELQAARARGNRGPSTMGAPAASSTSTTGTAAANSSTAGNNASAASTAVAATAAATAASTSKANSNSSVKSDGAAQAAAGQAGAVQPAAAPTAVPEPSAFAAAQAADVAPERPAPRDEGSSASVGQPDALGLQGISSHFMLYQHLNTFGMTPITEERSQSLEGSSSQLRASFSRQHGSSAGRSNLGMNSAAAAATSALLTTPYTAFEATAEEDEPVSPHGSMGAASSPFAAAMGMSPFAAASAFGTPATGSPRGTLMGAPPVASPFGAASVYSPFGQVSGSPFGNASQPMPSFNAAAASPFGAAAVSPFGAASGAPYGAMTSGPFAAASGAQYGASVSGSFAAASGAQYGASASGPFAATSGAQYGASTSGPFAPVAASPFGAAASSPFGAVAASPFADAQSPPVSNPSVSGFGAAASPFGAAAGLPFGEASQSAVGGSPQGSASGPQGPSPNGGAPIPPMPQWPPQAQGYEAWMTPSGQPSPRTDGADDVHASTNSMSLQQLAALQSMQGMVPRMPLPAQPHAPGQALAGRAQQQPQLTRLSAGSRQPAAGTPKTQGPVQGSPFQQPLPQQLAAAGFTGSSGLSMPAMPGAFSHPAGRPVQPHQHHVAWAPGTESPPRNPMVAVGVPAMGMPVMPMAVPGMFYHPAAHPSSLSGSRFAYMPQAPAHLPVPLPLAEGHQWPTEENSNGSTRSQPSSPTGRVRRSNPEPAQPSPADRSRPSPGRGYSRSGPVNVQALLNSVSANRSGRTPSNSGAIPVPGAGAKTTTRATSGRHPGASTSPLRTATTEPMSGLGVASRSSAKQLGLSGSKSGSQRLAAPAGSAAAAGISPQLRRNRQASQPGLHGAPAGGVSAAAAGQGSYYGANRTASIASSLGPSGSGGPMISPVSSSAGTSRASSMATPMRGDHTVAPMPTNEEEPATGLPAAQQHYHQPYQHALPNMLQMPYGAHLTGNGVSDDSRWPASGESPARSAGPMEAWGSRGESAQSSNDGSMARWGHPASAGSRSGRLGSVSGALGNRPPLMGAPGTSAAVRDHYHSAALQQQLLQMQLLHQHQQLQQLQQQQQQQQALQLQLLQQQQQQALQAMAAAAAHNSGPQPHMVAAPRMPLSVRNAAAGSVSGPVPSPGNRTRRTSMTEASAPSAAAAAIAAQVAANAAYGSSGPVGVPATRSRRTSISEATGGVPNFLTPTASSAAKRHNP